MSHPTIEELHDMAYGFRPEEEHTLDCTDCAETVRLIAEERAFFRRALIETPRASKWARLIPLAAAGGLAAGMLWAVFRPPRTELPTPVPAQERSEEKFDVERFVRELKSSNALRRAAARQALKAHGGAAVEAVRAAGEKELLEEMLGSDDPAIRERLSKSRFTCSFSDASVQNVADFFKDFTGLNIVVDPGLDDRKVTIDLKDVTLEEALRKILEPLKLRFEAEDGVLLITARPKGAPEGFVPLRFPVSAARRREILAEVANLADGSLEKREAAAARLEQFGFAAEETLWEGLDASSADVTSACAGLLGRLYQRTTRVRSTANPLTTKLRSSQVIVKMSKATLQSFIDSIADAADVSLMLDAHIARETIPITLDVTDISADNALQSALAAHGLAFVDVGDVLVVAPFERMPVRTQGNPQPALWVSPEEAGMLAPLFEKSDWESLRKIGVKAVPWLRFAQKFVDADLAAKYEGVARAVLEKTPGWFPDEPCGLRRQGGNALAKFDATRMDIHLLEHSMEDVLEYVSSFTGARIVIGCPVPPGLERWTLKLTGVRVSLLLDLLTRPYGLDYAEKDGKIVIDTKAEIRKLVGK